MIHHQLFNNLLITRSAVLLQPCPSDGKLKGLVEETGFVGCEVLMIDAEGFDVEILLLGWR